VLFGQRRLARRIGGRQSRVVAAASVVDENRAPPKAWKERSWRRYAPAWKGEG